MKEVEQMDSKVTFSPNLSMFRVCKFSKWQILGSMTPILHLLPEPLPKPQGWHHISYWC